MDEQEAQIGRSANTRRVIEWDDDDNNNKGEKKPGLCCLQGCLAVSSVGISFFVALPTGILLLVLSENDDNKTVLLAIGCVLVSLPVLVLLIVILLCLNQTKLSRLKFWKTNQKTTPNAQSTAQNIPQNDINSNTISLKNAPQPKSNLKWNSNDSTISLSLKGNSRPTSADGKPDPKTVNYHEIHI